MQSFYERYKSHILLKEIGSSGQKRIMSSRVLIVGAGGLGSPLALYLAAAGVGNIGIIDFDNIDVSNLQRQILYKNKDIGESKVEIAKKCIEELNPDVKVCAYSEKLTSANALQLFKNYDVVADAADNFQTRYLVNDACALVGIPDVWASVYKFEGQVSVFDAKIGACYRCFHPVAPQPGSVPSCGEGGVLGAVTGIIGSIQACEVLKIITGIGRTLTGHLLYFDAFNNIMRDFKIIKSRNCPLCGEHPSIKKLIDYDEFCHVDKFAEDEITLDEVKAKLKKSGNNIRIINICEEDKEENLLFPESVSVVLSDIGFLKAKLDASMETVFICRYGYKSIYAVRLLKEAGYKGKMYSLKGGTDKYL